MNWEITRVHDGGVPAVPGGSGRRTPCEGTRVHGSGIFEQSATGAANDSRRRWMIHDYAEATGEPHCNSCEILHLLQLLPIDDDSRPQQTPATADSQASRQWWRKKKI